MLLLDTVGNTPLLKFEFPNAVVYGHNDFTDKKVCPCFDAKKEYSEISNFNNSQ